MEHIHELPDDVIPNIVRFMDIDGRFVLHKCGVKSIGKVVIPKGLEEKIAKMPKPTTKMELGTYVVSSIDLGKGRAISCTYFYIPLLRGRRPPAHATASTDALLTITIGRALERARADDSSFRRVAACGVCETSFKSREYRAIAVRRELC